MFKLGKAKSKYKYTAAAEEFIGMLPKFERQAFEKWVDTIVLQIGSNNVLQYLDEKKRWNTKCILISDKIKCDFSQQSKQLIKQLVDFNEYDCRTWFSNALVMDKSDIQNYLQQVK